MFSFVGSVCFITVSYFRFVLFRFFCCLVSYCLSHHLQGRVRDSDPMEGGDSGSTVGPAGYFLLPVVVSLLFI